MEIEWIKLQMPEDSESEPELGLTLSRGKNGQYAYAYLGFFGDIGKWVAWWDDGEIEATHYTDAQKYLPLLRENKECQDFIMEEVLDHVENYREEWPEFDSNLDNVKIEDIYLLEKEEEKLYQLIWHGIFNFLAHSDERRFITPKK